LHKKAENLKFSAFLCPSLYSNKKDGIASIFFAPNLP
ncbi:MAG: hypothetical protein ACI9CZ_001729, partial [Flavobacterium sp.]